jgi:hypothetical protein
MKLAIGIALLALSIGPAASQLYGSQSSNSNSAYGTGSNPNSHYVQPHSNSNGTYTQGHYQTNPNSTQLDNYGTRGNVNPYTGQVGTRTPRY